MMSMDSHISFLKQECETFSQDPMAPVKGIKRTRLPVSPLCDKGSSTQCHRRSAELVPQGQSHGQHRQGLNLKPMALSPLLVLLSTL